MGAPPDQTAFWNQQSGKSFTHPLDVGRFTRGVPRDAHILDYGCGQGRLCAQLAELGYHRLTGMDSAPEMIREARNRVPAANFLLNDALPLPGEAASVDVVLLFAVLTCIAGDQPQKKLIGEFKRLLRPQGLIIVSDYPLQTDERNLARYAQFAQQPGGYGSFRLPDGALLRHHRREWFDELLGAFRIEETRELDVLTMNGNPARILQLWARKSASA